MDGFALGLSIGIGGGFSIGLATGVTSERGKLQKQLKKQ